MSTSDFPNPANQTPQSKSWRPYVIGSVVVVSIIVIVIIVVVLTSGNGSSKTCGPQATPKPTTGKLVAQCGNNGSLKCDEDSSTWYCDCGGTNLSTYESATCTGNNPTAFCDTNSKANCGCGGQTMDSWQGKNAWCAKTGTTPVSAVCMQDDETDHPLGYPACQCGTEASGNVSPMITSVNSCDGLTGGGASWICRAPVGAKARAKYSGVIDCDCNSQGGLEKVLKNAPCTGGSGSCVYDESLLTKTGAQVNQFISENCGCDCACNAGSTPWQCSQSS